MIGQIIELHANVDDANLFHEHSRLFTRHVGRNFIYQFSVFQLINKSIPIGS